MNELIVTIAHLRTIPGFSRRSGFCRRGAQAFFDRHGLDWPGFVKHGIPAEQLVATQDGMALALVEWAKECERGR